MIINLINVVRLSSHQQIRDEEHVWGGERKRGRDSEKAERARKGGMADNKKPAEAGFFNSCSGSYQPA